MAALKHVISRLTVNRTGDNVGFVAQFLQHSPDDFLNTLLHVMTQVLISGNVPPSWQITLFKMLPKTSASKAASDFRPIANVGFANCFSIPHVGTHARFA